MLPSRGSSKWVNKTERVSPFRTPVDALAPSAMPASSAMSAPTTRSAPGLAASSLTPLTQRRWLWQSKVRGSSRWESRPRRAGGGQVSSEVELSGDGFVHSGDGAAEMIPCFCSGCTTRLLSTEILIRAHSLCPDSLWVPSPTSTGPNCATAESISKGCSSGDTTKPRGYQTLAVVL